MISQQKMHFFRIIINIFMFIIFILSIPMVVHFGQDGLSISIIINAVIGIMSLLGLSILYLVNNMVSFSEEKSSKLFREMIVIAYMGIIFDNLSWVIDGVNNLWLIDYVMNVGGFLVMPFLLGVYWNYQQCIFADQSMKYEKIKKVVNITLAVYIIYVVVGSATGFLFYIDEGGSYVGGIGVNILYIFPISIIGCCFIENIRMKMSIQKRLPLLSFVLLPYITIAMLIFFPDYSLVYVMFFFDFILIYGTVENKRYIESLEQNAKISEQNNQLIQQQTQIMVSQIQPHFLYNTLTAIYQLCDVDTKLAQKMIQDFSTYLRDNMDGIRSEHPVSFKKELAHTKTYLEIELLRFSDILEVEYDIQAEDFYLPALSLQPLVENAVKYGVRSREDGGKITISTKRKDGKIYVSVHDDGMGFDINQEKNDGKSHTGIINTRKRLELMMDARLIIDSQIGVGTTATIIINDNGEE